MATTKNPPGVYDYGDGGKRAIAKVGQGKEDRKEKVFPRGTAMREITAWQEDTRSELRKRDKPKAGSLLDELPRYLRLKRAEGMTAKQIKAREASLRVLFGVLGENRTRAEIGYDAIIDTLATLKENGCRAPKRTGKGGRAVNTGGRRGKELRNGSIRCYKNALQNYWTVLGGRSASNPVKDVVLAKSFPEPKRSKPPVISFPLFDRILDAMTDVGGPVVRGERRSEINLTRIRLRLIALCGLPQQQIRELTPEDIDWAERAVFVGRDKGAGLDGAWRPMGAYAMAALRAFAEAKAFGDFSSSSMHKSFCLARDKVAPGSTVTPYKLRHLFANTSLDAGADEKAASRINLHASEATSRIYRETAELKRDRAAWDRIDKWHRKQGRSLGQGAKGLDAGVGLKLVPGGN